MPDQDWTKPKPLGEFYSDPYDKDSDRITVTRGYIMWVMRETARLSAIVQTVELKNNELKAELERLNKPAIVGGYNISEYIRMANSETLEFDNGDMFADMTLPERIKYIVESHARLKDEVERLTSDIQMEKENEDRLVREWQRANNEVYGLKTQVAALIDDQTRLKAECQARQAENSVLAVECDSLKAEVERLETGIQPEGCNDAVGRAVELLLEKDQEIARLQSEVERLRKAGDEMAKNYFDTYWVLNAESTSRHEPASITNWEEAKQNQ
jgi:cell division protein FtsB